MAILAFKSPKNIKQKDHWAVLGLLKATQSLHKKKMNISNTKKSLLNHQLKKAFLLDGCYYKQVYYVVAKAVEGHHINCMYGYMKDILKPSLSAKVKCHISFKMRKVSLSFPSTFGNRYLPYFSLSFVHLGTFLQLWGWVIFFLLGVAYLSKEKNPIIFSHFYWRPL